MPIRRTSRGWWWGSRGPFETREKAEQVAQAAYAAGYQEHQDRPKKPGWRWDK